MRTTASGGGIAPRLLGKSITFSATTGRERSPPSTRASWISSMRLIKNWDPVARFTSSPGTAPRPRMRNCTPDRETSPRTVSTCGARRPMSAFRTYTSGCFVGRPSIFRGEGWGTTQRPTLCTSTSAGSVSGSFRKAFSALRLPCGGRALLQGHVERGIPLVDVVPEIHRPPPVHPRRPVENVHADRVPQDDHFLDAPFHHFR